MGVEFLKMEKRSNYLLLISTIIVVVLGIMKDQLGQTFVLLQSFLVILGFFAGIFGMDESRSKEFILVVLALLAVYFLASDLIKVWEEIFWIGDYLKELFTNSLVFLVPAAVSSLIKSALHLLSGKTKSKKKTSNR